VSTEWNTEPTSLEKHFSQPMCNFNIEIENLKLLSPL